MPPNHWVHTRQALVGWRISQSCSSWIARRLESWAPATRASWFHTLRTSCKSILPMRFACWYIPIEQVKKGLVPMHVMLSTHQSWLHWGKTLLVQIGPPMYREYIKYRKLSSFHPSPRCHSEHSCCRKGARTEDSAKSKEEPEDVKMDDDSDHESGVKRLAEAEEFQVRDVRYNLENLLAN